jgi:glycopeptide antibiotics resistance protein
MNPRWKYALLAVLALAIAIPSRNCLDLVFLPTFLWAAFFYFIFRILFPGLLPAQTAGLTLAFSVLIECSQLYHAPRIDQFRESQVVHYLLGSEFDWKDLLGYALGVLIAYLVDVRPRAY